MKVAGRALGIASRVAQTEGAGLQGESLTATFLLWGLERSDRPGTTLSARQRAIYGRVPPGSRLRIRPTTRPVSLSWSLNLRRFTP